MSGVVYDRLHCSFETLSHHNLNINISMQNSIKIFFLYFFTINQESKHSFIHEAINEGGEKEKLEDFVNFCEDTIFEVCGRF